MDAGPDLVTAEKVLSNLGEEQRSELLDSIVIALCTEGCDAGDILSSFLLAHEFQDLIDSAFPDLRGGGCE